MPKPHAKLRCTIAWVFAHVRRWLLSASCAGLYIAVFFFATQARGQVPESFPSPAEAPPDAVYAGETACAKCHVSEAETQPSTPMGRALELPADCAILRQHPRLTFRQGTYAYEIVTQGGTSIYTVTDGHDTISEPVLYALGLGEAGQTYVVRREGEYYESRVSFFNDTQSLDLTLGHDRSAPKTLEEALGRVMTPATTALCFGCHSTATVTAGRAHFDRLIPGVTCEACHGPGADHLAAVRQGKLSDLKIFNPGKLSPGDVAEFCGTCHRSWLQVELMHVHGIVTVRFQPYRLVASKCYDPEDPRISCLACHNPHQDLETKPSAYDAKCLACHRSSSAPSEATRAAASTSARATVRAKLDKARAPACRVAKRLCVTCHMPKYSLPGAHFKFTDHRIRVARPGAPYLE